MSDTFTTTSTYTETDVGTVVRRMAADLLMIGESSGCWSEHEAQEYADDIETLAKGGFLASIDVTLLSFGCEVRAVSYEVDHDAGSLVSRRPGGVRWPRLSDASLRVTLKVTPQYTPDAASRHAGSLHHTWLPSSVDLSHGGLEGTDGRDYVSNGYALSRKDFGA